MTSHSEPRSADEKPALYVLVRHSDYSGSLVFESEAKATERAVRHANEERTQAAVYKCELILVACPKDAEIVLP